MAWAPRYFRWQDDKWTRLSSRWIDRFMNGEEVVTPPDGPFEFASVYVLLDDGIAEAITKPWFERMPVQPDGRFDAHRLMAGALALIDIPAAPDPGSHLVNAESRFASRRHQAETTWQPTRHQLEQLVAALQKTRVSPRLARTLLDHG